MGLNANSGGRRTLANDQEKWTFGFGRVCGLVCTIAVLFGVICPSSLMVNLAHTPLAEIQRSGRVGLFSVHMVSF